MIILIIEGYPAIQLSVLGRCGWVTVGYTPRAHHDIISTVHSRTSRPSIVSSNSQQPIRVIIITTTGIIIIVNARCIRTFRPNLTAHNAELVGWLAGMDRLTYDILCHHRHRHRQYSSTIPLHFCMFFLTCGCHAELQYLPFGACRASKPASYLGSAISMSFLLFTSSDSPILVNGNSYFPLFPQHLLFSYDYSI